MLVIVEGQRCSGKTSLCTVLAEKLKEMTLHPVMQFKSTERSNNPMLAMLDKIVPMAYDDETIYIVDRCHMTEVVYTILNHREVAYPLASIGCIDQLLGMGKTLLVFAVASITELERRQEESGKPPEGDVAQIAAYFMNCLKITKIQNVRIADSENFTTEELANFVIADICTILNEGALNNDQGRVSIYDYPRLGEGIARRLDGSERIPSLARASN